VEAAILAAWQEVLGAAPGLDENFFDLGGTSLRMAAVHERLTRTLAPALRMTQLYQAPTVRSLARLIAVPSATGAGQMAVRGLQRGQRRRAHLKRANPFDPPSPGRNT
jgi:aryl carrier-like protein